MRYTRLMTEFSRRYNNLNPKQREAVDAIDGPVMVVAGPGTGKTELLSVRVANILQKTDVLPSNILCLTFTDSGAVAMRERLASLLGPDAYKVAVHTFHSFGSDIINQNSEFFYNGAHFRPANELNSYEILTEIMEKLPHSNPLASTMNGEFTYMRDIQTSISELKRGGLTPDELDLILDRNDAFINWIQPKLQQVFAEHLSKKSFGAITELASQILNYSDEPLELIGYTPLHQLIGSSLQTASESAETDNSTKPISAWKKSYLEKNTQGEHTLKDEKRSTRLHALSKVYNSYLLAMQERELYDYDDMILRVVHAMEIFPELRYNLQEAFQYIMVDEFQDTNDAQMRLVWNLTNNPSSEGRPNIMVVGDDDQAIYRFQGAELSNIIDFRNRYRDVMVITLADNYRSTADILQLARQVIVQGNERLENTLEGVNKTLTPYHTAKRPLLSAKTYETTSQSNFALSRVIADDYAKHPNDSRAVIARN
ncbi:ATP-dependent helicase, partial [Candidatus Saccharibacteria bacterium]|nr:ATP-dependent helicase [Candidatus Saccharibacteria bacterium]